MLIAMASVMMLAIPILILNVLRKIYRKENLSKYWLTVAIGFDQLGGSILYGEENWTVSSWTYLLSTNGNKYALRFMRFIDLLFGQNHCLQSFLNESKQQGIPR
jgi:hypothetical protein